jgi:hypothetical protein
MKDRVAMIGSSKKSKRHRDGSDNTPWYEINNSNITGSVQITDSSFNFDRRRTEINNTIGTSLSIDIHSFESRVTGKLSKCHGQLAFNNSFSVKNKIRTEGSLIN